MKQIPKEIAKSWIAWEAEAIDKSDFISEVDNYILGENNLEYELLELSIRESKSVYEIKEYFRRNIFDLDYDCSPEFIFDVVCNLFANGGLTVQQASKVLVRYFLNDEWGVLESPNEEINDLYDKWGSGTTNCSDSEYHIKLERLLGHS